MRYSTQFNNIFFVDVPDVDSVGITGLKPLQNFYVEGANKSEIFFISAIAQNAVPGSDNPNTTPYEYELRTLNLDNVHLQVTDRTPTSTLSNQPDLLIYDAINLNSSQLTFGNKGKLYWLGDHEINVRGSGNVINIGSLAWDSPDTRSTSLNIFDGSDLTLENTSEIYNKFNGNLTLSSSSTLNIKNSQIVLTSETSNANFKASTIDNATINISGTFIGPFFAHLHLTNPLSGRVVVTVKI